MSLLDTFTTWMKEVDVTGVYKPLPHIPDHKIQLVRFLINSRFNKNYSLEETYKLLYQEGLLEDSHYFSPWYVEKYSKKKQEYVQDI